MTQNRIYTIDDNQLDNLRRRILFRGLKWVGFMLLFITTFQLIQAKKGELLIVVSIIVITSASMIIAIFNATNKLVKSYKTLQIILIDEGVESKGEKMPFKSINWENLIIKVKSDDTINLYDKTTSSFDKNMYGKGWIAIQPEILNRGILLDELIKEQQAYA